MLRQSLRGLAIAAVAAFALGPAPAAAVTPVTSCRNLDKAGETYVLTTDLTETAVCFLILADRITLDLAGHTITGPAVPGSSSVGVWDFSGARISTVVKNGTIEKFGFGIFLRDSSRSTIRGVTTSDNGIGMTVGPNSLVKDCTVQRNTVHGIATGDNVQVEDCYVGGTPSGDDGNGGFGIVGGQRMLITRTTSNGNGNSGILVGMRSTVTFSTASNNGDDGIAVGQNSLVTRNTTNDNNGDGIEAVCPSTITHNTALGNDELDIRAIGTGCSILHNTVSL